MKLHGLEILFIAIVMAVGIFCYVAWKPSPVEPVTVTEATGLPVYSFIKQAEPLTNRAWSTNASLPNYEQGIVTYSFSTTNVELRYVDGDGQLWKGHWERHFTNAFKYSNPTTNNWAIRWDATSPLYSFVDRLQSGFTEGPSNTIVVVWKGSNVFAFPGKLSDANLYGPTNRFFRITETTPSTGSSGIQ